MPYNAADMFEHTVDVVADRVALICGDERRTYAELDRRANSLAHHLIDAGIRPGDHIGIYAQNGLPWMEALLGILKARAVPVNVNYRYVEDELRYLFHNADLKALFYSEEYGPRVAHVFDQLPLLRDLVMIEDGSGASQEGLSPVPFEVAVASGSPERDFGERSGDDQIIIYTGGTTGMPKGVMWRGEDIFFALAGGTDPFTREKVASEYELSEKAAASGGQLVYFNTPPLMHGAAFVATLMALFQGNCSVLIRHFEPTEVWRTIARERINSVLIVGDAMGRPLIEALEALDAAGEELDLSCLLALSSSAAVFSPAVKDRFIERFPTLVITDSIGATESGFNGIVAVGKGNTAMKGGGPTVQPGRDTVVLDSELRPVEPGSGVVGMVARGGNIPLGYYGDPDKTASVFVTAADGRRYAVPGDFATVEADGTITLLGRGSVSINTGGEKVYPEEVEQALKAHPDVFDALVVGVPDERWGQRVAAVVQPREGRVPSLADLQAHCREHIAGYKVPRELHLVDTVVRSPSGKPDYPWAKKVAESATPAGG
ncbi:MAG: acyl-CoA synthetase [Acidimicrobiales bacterium]|jgi:acyl-CoA synthetase (AMP-forming)/AMP-acid ligase II|nr:acyl-CoA synthetase [Acidimicrobiales bacterium]